MLGRLFHTANNRHMYNHSSSDLYFKFAFTTIWDPKTKSKKQKNIDVIFPIMIVIVIIIMFLPSVVKISRGKT